MWHYQKNFFAAASCWLLQQREKPRTLGGALGGTVAVTLISLLVHDVAEEQHRLNHDEDCEVHGGQAGRHGGNFGALHRLLCRILQAEDNCGQTNSHMTVTLHRCSLNPDLGTALDQVLHVPLDHVKMLLDVTEVLDGLVVSHADRCALLLRRADLLQRLLEGVPAETEQSFRLQQREKTTQLDPVVDLFCRKNLQIYRSGCFH